MDMTLTFSPTHLRANFMTLSSPQKLLNISEIHPKKFSRIADRVAPGGILAIMTRFYPTEDKVFAELVL